MMTVRGQPLPEHNMDEPKPEEISEEIGEMNLPSPSVSKAFIDCSCYGIDCRKSSDRNGRRNVWGRRDV